MADSIELRRRGLEKPGEEILFNPADHVMKTQHMINYNTGGLTSLSNSQRKYLVTYAAVKPNTKYKLSSSKANFGTGSNFGTAFYDESKVYLSGIANAGGSSQTFTTPPGCAYFRFSVTSSNAVEDVLNGITLEYA